ncbi:MAG: ThiF family adenylyltransferase, partial [Burkholderiales bacterium]|nr:ThiF family adenylyltransferase [Burkholderiales bacterium]
MRPSARLLALALLPMLHLLPQAQAAEALSYQQPSEAMRAVLDAPPLPVHSLSPDQRWLLSITPRRGRPIAELARPVTRLAGMKLDAEARAPFVHNPLVNEINPNIEITLYNERLTRDNALDILRDYDIIADGTDNFATRY